MELYKILKALHIIFVVTWFAGLFYIVRLFIYQIEASQKASPEKEILGNQLKIMANRLWNIIAWPSAIITAIVAFWLLLGTTYGKAWLQEPWMHIKLGFVFLLYLYHFKCHQIYKQLQNDVVKYTSSKMRLFNEIATLILFSIVFLVVLKSTFNWIYGVLGLIALAVVLMILIKLYKRYREKK